MQIKHITDGFKNHHRVYDLLKTSQACVHTAKFQAMINDEISAMPTVSCCQLSQNGNTLHMTIYSAMYSVAYPHKTVLSQGVA